MFGLLINLLLTDAIKVKCYKVHVIHVLTVAQPRGVLGVWTSSLNRVYENTVNSA